MKYEAKKDGSKNPVSEAAGTPWVSVDWYEARAACQRAGAHLVTNAQWMTVARNIESTTINDMDADAALQLATGHSDNSPANSLASTAGADPVVSGCNLNANMEDASNAYSGGSCEVKGSGAGGSTDADKGYYGTGQSWSDTGYSAGAANKSQLRTHILSNGNVIWDFAGNVWEWTSDWWADRHPDNPTKPCCAPRNPRGAARSGSHDRTQPGPVIPRRVLKGGSHLCAENYCRRYRPAARHPQPIDTTTSHIGFRCVVRKA